MPRPENKRIVHVPPLFTEFKPLGVSDKSLENLIVSLDEFEAIRLADYVGLSHEVAAEEMNISRSTFSRLIERARKKMADFIVQGRAISIDGGSVHFKNNIIKCESCGNMFVIKIEHDIPECPKCHSVHLTNMAGRFGHGKCCIDTNN